MQKHLSLGQHRFKAAAHACAVRGQYVRAAGEQVKTQLVRIAALHAQLAAQPVLKGQCEFNPAGTAADQRNARFARLPPHALQQGQPAFVEKMNRLDRYRVLGGTRHPVHLRR